MVVKPQHWAECAESVPGSDPLSGGAMDSPHSHAGANGGVFIGPDTEPGELLGRRRLRKHCGPYAACHCAASATAARSEEHTSELQSRGHLVCRLLLEKKKKNNDSISRHHIRD